MKTIKIKPVEILGTCRANLTLDDEFQIKGMNLENPRQSKLCFLALGHFPPIISQLQGKKHFFAHLSCPDCLSRMEQENGVVFLLGQIDKWDLSQAISEYRRLCKQYAQEPEAAKQLEAEATQYQKQGEYSMATQKMEAAVQELKRVFA